MRRYHISPIALLLAGLAAGLLPNLLMLQSAFAAQARETPYVRYPGPPSQQAAIKSVVGEVHNADGAALPQAVVHLKNKKTLEVKTRISDGEGKYVFRGLDRDSDYEVHAEFQGSSSPRKNVSSFDDRDEVVVVLQIQAR